MTSFSVWSVVASSAPCNVRALRSGELVPGSFSAICCNSEIVSYNLLVRKEDPKGVRVGAKDFLSDESETICGLKWEVSLNPNCEE